MAKLTFDLDDEMQRDDKNNLHHFNAQINRFDQP